MGFWRRLGEQLFGKMTFINVANVTFSGTSRK